MSTTLNTVNYQSLLTVEEFASRLGVRTSWVYDRTGPKSREHIPFFKFGHHVRLDDPFKPQTEEMQKWMRSSRKK